jgi:large subunit ribosomal protein L18
MIKQFNANQARLKRHRRMRSRLEGSQSRPRLNVYRSGMHIYAQVIDDTTGQTLASASSLDEALRNFAPEKEAASAREPKSEAVSEAAPVEMVTEVAPTKGKGARTEKTQAKGGQPQRGNAGKGGKPFTQVKTQLPSAVKGAKKTPVEALEAIADNRKVALAREVGKLVAQRAKDKGISQVVFDRGGYAYHGRVAALAEGAREIGLSF